jgi:multidrug efflux system membrane fusion protein
VLPREPLRRSSHAAHAQRIPHAVADMTTLHHRTRPFRAHALLAACGAAGSTRLTTLVSVDPIHLSFETDERTYLKHGLVRAVANAAARGGEQRTVQMALAGDTTFGREGRLDFVDDQLDATRGTVRARAVFPNHDRSLAPGLFARARLAGSTPARAVLVRDAERSLLEAQDRLAQGEADATTAFAALYKALGGGWSR